MRSIQRRAGKLANATKLGFSYLYSIMAKRAIVGGMPFAISFELTNNCNLNCPECATGSGKMDRKRGFMDIDLFTNTLEQLKPYLYHINLYYQGEPMLHPGFFTFLERCTDITTTVSTNGHFLDLDNAGNLVKSGLNKLIISLDGMTKEIYSTYRVSGDFNKVIQGIYNVSRAKKEFSSPMKLVIQYLVNKQNEHQIQLAQKFAKETGASLELKSMQILDPGESAKWVPHNKNYSRYSLKKGHYEIKSNLPNRCLRPWLYPVVTWNGKVLPCCFDKNGEQIMGDLNTESFRDIWEGNLYRTFRENVLTNRAGIKICTNCCSGLKGVKG